MTDLPDRCRAATYVDSGVIKDEVRTAVSQRVETDALHKDNRSLGSEREAGRLCMALAMAASRMSSDAFEDPEQGNKAKRTKSWGKSAFHVSMSLKLTLC